MELVSAPVESEVKVKAGVEVEEASAGSRFSKPPSTAVQFKAPVQQQTASRHIRQPAFTAAFWEQWVLQGASATRPSGAPAGVPQRSAADWLGRHSRLVVVSPHPDDEVLMCSGLIQQQLQRGGPVHVVALTDGEACFGPDAERAAVGLQRREEAAAGLHALGASAAEVHHYGLPDGALAEHQRAVEQRLCDLLQPGDLVVSTWRWDGHPDHEVAARAAALACSARGATLLEAPVWMWHWARPDHPAIDWTRLARMPLSGAVRECKWQALQCHQSQLVPRGGQPPVVDAALQTRTRWPFECFFTP